MGFCFSCLKSCDDKYKFCPFCGKARETAPVELIHLVPGTVLQNRYILGTAVGSGGFGIIYKAWDTKLETVVAVKEFFASKLVTRAAGEKKVIVNKRASEEFKFRKERFLAEARNMAKFGNHRNIPNVFEFFEENGTAYIVMELLEGEALNKFIRRKGGKIDKDFAIYIANEVGNALISMHDNGIVHRDVAPDNIYICSDTELHIKLLDLGAAKLADNTDKVIDIVLKPGYSPVEQYEASKGIGPWTDVYALGATLYYMLTGVKPDESTNRKIKDTVVPPKKLDPTISENLSNAIMKALAVDRHMRFKTVSEFLKAINGEKKIMTLAKEKKLRKRRRFTGILAAVAALVVIGIVIASIFISKRSEQVLDEATISLWYYIPEGSNKTEAITKVAEDFCGKNPNIKIDLTGFPEKEYRDALIKAAAEGKLPTLFESTGISDGILYSASDVENVLNSPQAKECMFLSEYYGSYYPTQKRVPLAFEVPVAAVITNGANSVDYSKNYFSALDEFGSEVTVAIDGDHKELVQKNFPERKFADREKFMDASGNTAEVMLTTTLEIQNIKVKLTNYEKRFVYPENEKIYCAFTFEWSIGNGEKAEIKAAERLLSWMLGNNYQNMLMISRSSDGQIPLNPKAFEEKITQSNYAPIKDIYGRFVFEN